MHIEAFFAVAQAFLAVGQPFFAVGLDLLVFINGIVCVFFCTTPALSLRSAGLLERSNLGERIDCRILFVRDFQLCVQSLEPGTGTIVLHKTWSFASKSRLFGRLRALHSMEARSRGV